MENLKTLIHKSNLSDEQITEISRMLLLSYHLSTLQMNVWNSLENIFKRNGFYKFEIKHNHRQIKKLVRASYPDFMKALDDRKADALCSDTEEFERIVYDWAGIKTN